MVDKILNLGCGNDCYGTDRLDFKKTGATTLIHDLNKPLPFKSNTFNEVKAFAVFEHLSNCGNFVDEIHRVLKKGGKVKLTTDNASCILYHFKGDHNDYLSTYYENNRNKEDYHRQLFVPSHLKAYFKEFRNVKVEYFSLHSGLKGALLCLIPKRFGWSCLYLEAVK